MLAADGTPDKSRLGGNAIVAVSLAVAHAAANAEGVPLWRYLAAGKPVTLPPPEIQIFGGGAHAGRRLDLQDVMVMPVGAASFADALAMVAEIYRAAGAWMSERGRVAGVADEGGWWPQFDTNEEALQALVAAIERAGFAPGRDAVISLDIAASELITRDGRYRLALDGRELDRGALGALWRDWLDRYPIASIEDPFAEDDDAGWRAFARAAGDRVQIVGDDFLTTSAARSCRARRELQRRAAETHQAGTLTERAAFDAARAAGFRDDRLGALGRNRGRVGGAPGRRLERR